MTKRKYACDDDGEPFHGLATEKRRRHEPPRHLSPPRSESPPAAYSSAEAADACNGDDESGRAPLADKHISPHPSQHLSPPLSLSSPSTPQSARATDTHSESTFSVAWPTQFNNQTGTPLADPELLIARLQQVKRHRESGLEHSWRVAKYGEEVALMYPGNLTPPYIREEWWKDQQRKEDEFWQEIEENDRQLREKRNRAASDQLSPKACDARDESQTKCEDECGQADARKADTGDQLKPGNGNAEDEGRAENENIEAPSHALDADLPDPAAVGKSHTGVAAGLQSGDDAKAKMEPAENLGVPDAAEDKDQNTNDKAVETHGAG